MNRNFSFTEVAISAERPIRSETGSVRRAMARSEEHTSELQSRQYLVCRLLLEKNKRFSPSPLPRYHSSTASLVWIRHGGSPESRKPTGSSLPAFYERTKNLFLVCC